MDYQKECERLTRENNELTEAIDSMADWIDQAEALNKKLKEEIMQKIQFYKDELYGIDEEIGEENLRHAKRIATLNGRHQKCIEAQGVLEELLNADP